MKNTIYIKYPNGVCSSIRDTFYRTAEEAVKMYMASDGIVVISKKEHDDWLYDTCFQRMKKAIESESIGEVWSILVSNDNKQSIKAFSEITGVTLSKKQGERLSQIRAFYGEKWEQWNAEQARIRREKREARDVEQMAQHMEYVNSTIESWKSNKFISVRSFLTLCAHFGIELHPRTKGFLNKRVSEINSKHQYYKIKGAGTSSQLYHVVSELNKAVGI